MTELTRQLAQAIVQARPQDDAAAITAARQGVLDFLACALGGVGDRAVSALVAALPPGALQQPVGASIFGQQSGRAEPGTAALVNGSLGHALDFDDVHGSVRGHPSTVVLPALFAAAEVHAKSAQQLLEAYVVGVETMARLGLAVGVHSYEVGFHNTAVLGSVGAAAAVARLLGLDAAATANALGLAATQSAGLRLQFGSDAKPVHAGLAARAGLFAVDLAVAGLTGNDAFLDGATGFVNVYGGADAQPALAVRNWGAPWQIVAPGLSFKAYACCNAIHYAADAALDLYQQQGLRAADIARVTVVFPRGGDTPLLKRPPRDRVDARFSVEYVMAAAFTDGALALPLFAEGPLREDLAAFLPRVARRIDESAPPVSTDPASRFSTVEVLLHDGREFSQRVERPRGAQNTASKFRDATRGDAALAGVPDQVGRMSSSADLAALIATLRHGPAS